MAIFTAAAVAGFLAIEATSAIAVAGAFVLNTAVSFAASIGVSYAARAIAGNSNQSASSTADHFGVQQTLAGGGDVPRAFPLGWSVTAGSLVYANTYGGDTETPNAYLSQVIAVSDMPGCTLEGVWIAGEKVTLDIPGVQDVGYPVNEYKKDGREYLWIKYYDGTQTTADSHLVNEVSSVDRPYESTRVGTGVAYVIVTSLVEDTLFPGGVPTCKFELSGIPLYDPTKDSTNGGTGSHRWSDSTTWGGDGDDFPAVQAYNLLRGIYYDGTWLYGLQRMTGARLPAANWNAQIEKCRATITGEDGAEPTYRTGGQINVNAQIANTAEAILTGCQGKISEVGGFYKIQIGAPDSSVLSFTDDDILSTEGQNFAPFFPLSNSINGITASGPDPAQGWNTVPEPPLYNADFEAADGDSRLLANPSFDFVPYRAQRQRLMKSALEEARRARRHTIVGPPGWWTLEPGDVTDWTSTRNGYSAKLMRVDGVRYKANLDIELNLTEVDPTDYDWTHAVDFQPATSGGVPMVRPAAQGVVIGAAGSTHYDAAGLARRPALTLTWDGTIPGVDAIQFEARLAANAALVASKTAFNFSDGELKFAEALLPGESYEVRSRLIPNAPRDVTWSDWMPFTAPDIRLGYVDSADDIRAQITTVMDALESRLANVEQRFATAQGKIAARQWLDTKRVESRLSVQTDTAFAQIYSVQQVSVAADAALASSLTTLTATVAGNTASISTQADAISTLNGYAAARYGVTLDVNGYASGFTLINAGTSYSSFTILVDNFQIAKPGTAGGDAVPIFTIGNVAGVPKVGIRSDVFIDGTITATMIAAGTITAAKIAAGTITATEIAANTITAAKIVAGTITATEIAANTITAAKIAAGTITASEIAASTITGAKIAANTIAAANIVAGTITATELAADSVTAVKILANTITAAKIVAGTITTTQIAANTIVAGNIAAGTITATEIAAGTITAAKIAAGTITATQIAAGTIAAANIAAATITTAQIAVGGVDLANIVAGAATNIAASGEQYLADTVGTNTVVTQAITVSGGGGSGKVLVIATFRGGGETPNAVTGSLTIDGGASVYDVDYRTVVTSVDFGTNGHTAALAPITFTYLATGLSDASHTFRLRTTRSYTGSYASLVLINLRR